MLIYLALVNLLAFVMFGIDKYKAQHDRWRIREAKLIGIAVIGGSVGAWLGMLLWHHKTQHLKFRFGLPFILLLHLASLLAFILYT